MGLESFKNIRPNRSSDGEDVRELLTEITGLLPRFIDSMVFKRDYFEGSDENHLTETLIKFIENANRRSRFSFKAQAQQGARRSVDIGIHLKADSEHYIYCLEAKYLPSSDYVQGDYAAIKRFKKCEHGLSNFNPDKARFLPQNGIIAYMKSGNFQLHYRTIEGRIKELISGINPDRFGLIWMQSELLIEVSFAEIAILSSTHWRLGAGSVELDHFWIPLPSV